MLKKIISRLLLMVLVVFIVLTIIFISFNFYMINLFEADYTFGEFIPIGMRLLREFIEVRIINWDWGYTVNGDPVIETVFPRLWVSLKYLLLSVIIFVPVGIFLGVITAYYKDSWFDKLVSRVVLVFGSMPTYLILAVSIAVFGYLLHMLPRNYYFVYFDFWSPASGYVIPMLTMCAYPIAIITNTIRGEVIDAFNSEKYSLCIAKGLTRRQVLLRHSLRECLVPLMPVLSDLIIFVLASSFIVEVYYNIPGVAELFYDSLIQLVPDLAISVLHIDIKTTMIIVSYYMFISLFLILIADIATFYIDPRIRHNEKI